MSEQPLFHLDNTNLMIRSEASFVGMSYDDYVDLMIRKTARTLGISYDELTLDWQSSPQGIIDDIYRLWRMSAPSGATFIDPRRDDEGAAS